MSRSICLCLVALLGVAGCREDAVVAPRALVPGGALGDGNVSRPGVASGYVAVDLNMPLISGSSRAMAINNSRQIVIEAGLSSYVWQNGSMTEIGLPDARAISDNGTVAGAITVGCCSHAARWDGGSITDLGVLSGSTSIANGVNDAGQVVGWSTSPIYYHGFVSQNGTMTDLGSFGGAALDEASGINALGQIVGRSGSASDFNFDHAFVWENGVMSDLGRGAGLAINTAGVIAGESWVSSTAILQQATIWQNGVGTTLGVLPGDSSSRATGINTFGQVVGISASRYTVGFGGDRAFLWENGVMTELPQLPQTVAGNTWALGINDSGDIVGWGSTPTGAHAILWTKTPPNRPPTASSGGPYPGTEGTAVTFDGSASADPDGNALTYDWDFGDGTAHGTGVAPSHTYPDNGTFPITLTVSDGALSAVAATSATIANALPAPNAGLDQAFVVSRSTSFVPAFTDAGLADGPWSYTLQWGDGTANVNKTAAAQGTQPALTHTYATVGSYLRRLTVTDKDGGVAFDEATITVAVNQPPVASVNGPYTGKEGTGVVFSSAGSSDPNGDALTYSWKFGDGSTSTAANPSHTYTDNNTYTVTVTVKDVSGATNAATTTATIANVAPTATLSAPSTITEGVTATVALNSGTDKGAADRPTLEYAFDCGQGAGLGPWSKTVKNVACPAFPNQRPPVTVVAQIRDKDGGLTQYQKTMTVTNAAPVVTLVAASPTTFPAGGGLDMQGSFSDKGTADAPWATKIVWGDGTAATTGSVGAMGALPPAHHNYATAGTFQVQLTVTDKDGKAGLSTKITVVVTP